MPTRQKKIKAILYLLNNQKGKAVDLGSGDGRIIIALALKGFEAHGYEINPFLVWWSRYKIRKAGLKGKAFVHKKSYWDEDFSEYDVIVVFGILNMMERLEKKMQKELNTGAVVVSSLFEFPNWEYYDKKDGVYIYQK